MNRSIPQSAVNPARDAAVDALLRLDTTRWLPVDVDTSGLDHRDGQLARAIYRTAVQRKLTIDNILRTLVPKLTPACRCILEAAAGQLIFLDRLPDYAIIDIAVEQARRRDRAASAGMVNAVCRNIQRGIAERQPTGGYHDQPHTIPWRDGFVRLDGKCRVTTNDEPGQLSFATSTPVPLVRAWCDTFGRQQARELLLHSVGEAPTIVCGAGVESLSADLATPHQRPGFACWTGDHAQLIDFLDGARDRWVQDVTAALPAIATGKCPSGAVTEAGVIIDYCAGRGTKTRQLAAMHPKAKVIATDIDPVRHAELQASLVRYANAQVVPFDRIDRFAGQCDLLLLDVPCSNTGVLSRRLEARYRYSHSMLYRMTALQRKIVEAAMPLLKPTGSIVYSTCSIESCENADQAHWIAERCGMTIAQQQLTLPGGSGPTYHDGGYFAVLSPPGTS